MELMPSRSMLEETGFFERGFRYAVEYDYDKKDQENCEFVLTGHLSAYFILLDQTYRRPFDMDLKIPEGDFFHNVVHTAGEALKNSRDHVHKDKGKVGHIIYFGAKGLCQGFLDDGDFFKSPEIKKQYESKTEVTEFDLRFEKGYRIGVNGHIFPMSDKIEVDTNSGVLWTLHLLKEGDYEPYVLGSKKPMLFDLVLGR